MLFPLFDEHSAIVVRPFRCFNDLHGSVVFFIFSQNFYTFPGITSRRTFGVSISLLLFFPFDGLFLYSLCLCLDGGLSIRFPVFLDLLLFWPL